jgi:hypothetical protein
MDSQDFRPIASEIAVDFNSLHIAQRIERVTPGQPHIPMLTSVSAKRWGQDVRAQFQFGLPKLRPKSSPTDFADEKFWTAK